MNSQANSESKPLDKVYLEASQWVRFANTVIWSVGTLLVPVSLGIVGLALNTTTGAQFPSWRKVFLGIGSVFLFSFWVYASRIYKLSSIKAREVLIKIEREWEMEGLSLYESQEPIVKRKPGLFGLQIATLVGLVLVWVLILCREL